MTDFPVTIFHNPACGTSRNTLALVKAAGYAPEVVEYLQTGWTVEQLKGLLAAMGMTPRQVMRSKGDLVGELGLTDPSVSDETILKAMVEHPILVERPIVRTPWGVVLARPSEKVVEVLEHAPESFTKEDGTVVAL